MVTFFAPTQRMTRIGIHIAYFCNRNQERKICRENTPKEKLFGKYVKKRIGIKKMCIFAP